MSAPVAAAGQNHTCTFNLYVSFKNERLARLGAYVVLNVNSQEYKSQDIFKATQFEVTIPAHTRAIKATLGALDGAIFVGPFAGQDKSLILKDEDTVEGRDEACGNMLQTLTMRC